MKMTGRVIKQERQNGGRRKAMSKVITKKHTLKGFKNISCSQHPSIFSLREYNLQESSDGHLAGLSLLLHAYE